ncbi:MAG TPA: hypothetical protein VKG87_07430, partial [Terriglobales bacterium]|nr:hypothetical protein [Terriglobales bacterium]
GGYAGFRATSSTWAIAISGFTITPGIDDDGTTGTLSPEVGLRASGTRSFTFSDGVAHAATTPIQDSGSNTLFSRGPNVVTATGTITSPTYDLVQPVSAAIQSALAVRPRFPAVAFANQTSYTAGQLVYTSTGLLAVALQDQTTAAAPATITTSDAWWQILGTLPGYLNLATVPAGYTHSMTYTAAIAAGTRPTARTDVRICIVGGTASDADPAWMIDTTVGGDFRDLIGA